MNGSLGLSNPAIHLRQRWLTVDLGSHHRVIGWPVIGPALGQGRRIAWLQVQNRDLPPGLSPADCFQKHADIDTIDADLGFLTAADISRYGVAGQGGAWALSTAGLSNGETVRPRQTLSQASHHVQVGTVNLLVLCPCPLALPACIEAISIVAEARTDAILSCGLFTADRLPVSGTGTDCIVVAAPMANRGQVEESHCGLHTPWGRAIAAASYQATFEACQKWQRPGG